MHNYNSCKESERGSAVLMSLMIFFVVSILAVAILVVAALESKISLNYVNREQALQAADAGIRVGRSIAMNYLAAGLTPPKNQNIKLNNNTTVSVNISSKENKSIINIYSKGIVREKNNTISAQQEAEAQMLVNGLPNYPARADSMKVMGKYYIDMDWAVAASEPRLGLDPWPIPADYRLYGPSCEGSPNPQNRNPNHFSYWVDYNYIYDKNGQKVAHNLQDSYVYLAPFYRPQGKVSFYDQYNNPAQVAFNQLNNNMLPGEADNLFYDVNDFAHDVTNIFGIMPNVITYEPDKTFNTLHFIDENIWVPNPDLFSFTERELEGLCRIAQDNPDRWEYIEIGDPELHHLGGNRYELVEGLVKKDVIFIDWDRKNSPISVPEDFTIVADFTKITNEANKKTNNIEQDNKHRIIIASPGNVEVGYDSLDVDSANTGLALIILSLQNIDLQLDPPEFNNHSRIISEDDIINRQARICLISGKNIKITSFARNMRIYGLLHAVKDIKLLIDYYDNNQIALIDKKVEITKQPDIIKEFPESWTFLGMGSLLSYKYLD
ncbi:MAG: pilus assembly PilX N-terminal domain-containing protein [Syntrophomonadaceae bacterium]|jgi:hypothetical protein